MKKELHCFILWEKSRRLENEIIEDIRKHFKIMKIFEIAWPKEFFADNLSRFYGKKLSKSICRAEQNRFEQHAIYSFCRLDDCAKRLEKQKAAA